MWQSVSGYLKNKNRWLIVYYGELTDDEKNSPEALQEKLKTALLGCVPDYWINIQHNLVVLPPVKNDYQLQSASCKRIEVADNWKEHPILKVRFDTAKTDFFEAQEMLKICEDVSSGAEEVFYELHDKTKRHDRHKVQMSDDDTVVDQSVVQKKLLTIKREKSKNIKKIKNSENSSFVSQLPLPPAQTLLGIASTSTENSDATAKNDQMDAFHSGFDQDVLQKDDESSPITEQGKPRIVGEERYPAGTSVLAKVIKKNSNDNKAKTKAKVDVGDASCSNNLGHSELRNPFQNITNTVKGPPVGQFKRIKNVSAIQSDNQDILVLNENFTIVDAKLNMLVENSSTSLGISNRILTNQIRAKILGPAPPCNTDTSWTERKRQIAAVFKKMNNLNLFLAFEDELESSKSLRDEVQKYLEEKMTPGNWKLTARNVLNASMDTQVQSQYSGLAQKGTKLALVETNLYPILEGIAHEASKNQKGVAQVSTETIRSYIGSYIRGADGKLKKRASSKRKNPNDVSVTQALLFGLPKTKKTKKSSKANGPQKPLEDAEEKDAEEEEAGEGDAEEEDEEETTDAAGAEISEESKLVANQEVAEQKKQLAKLLMMSDATDQTGPNED